MKFLYEEENSNKNKQTFHAGIWQLLLDNPDISYLDLVTYFNISMELSKDILKEANAKKLIKSSKECYTIEYVPEFFNLISNKIKNH